MVRRQKEQLTAMRRPANQQQNSMFFRLPPELRTIIYKFAFPGLGKPQHVYSGKSLACRPYGKSFDPKATEPLRFLPCHGLLDDDGIEILIRRCKDAKVDVACLRAHFDWACPRDPAEYRSPLALLLACRRVYQELAPMGSRSLSFSDLRALSVFLTTVSCDVLDRIEHLSVDIMTGSWSPGYREEYKLNLARDWKLACDNLARMKLQSFRGRISLSDGRHLGPTMANNLNVLAAQTPDMEIDLAGGCERRVLRPVRDGKVRRVKRDELDLARWDTVAEKKGCGARGWFLDPGSHMNLNRVLSRRSPYQCHGVPTQGVCKCFKDLHIL